MERVLFAILETSIIMSGAILLLMLFSKIFAGKTRPAKRHLCWLIVAVGLLVPYRPALLTVPLPQPQSYHESEALLFADIPLMLDWAGMEHGFEHGTHLNPASAVAVDPAISDCNIFVSGLEPGGILDTKYNPATTFENPTALENSAVLENPEEIILISVTETEEMASASIYLAELTTLSEIIWLSLFALWALGVLGIILFYTLRHIRFIRRVKKNSHEITFGPLHNLLIRIRCHVGIKRKVRLMTGPFITVPMMYGFFRPVIILPAYVLTSNEEQQRLIILHEALHIKRGDIIARLLCLTAVAVHWFNPLVHLMNRLALDESERACDDAVLRYSGVETRKQYSRTLLQVARQDAEAHDALNNDALAHEALAHALTSGGKNIKNRLKNILSQQNPGRLALLICTALMVVGVTIFSVIHFGGGSEDEPEYNYIQDEQGPDEEIHNILLQEPGEILRIFTPVGMWNMHITAAADAVRAAHGIALDITSYFTEERDDYIERKLSLFAAGMGPDIFVVDDHLYRYIQSGFLMDINELIPDRSLFYEGALAGFEVNGRLYALPMSFRFNMVGINAALPPDILARFAALETVSASQLMDIYSELVAAHPEFADFYFMNLYWLNSPMHAEITYALDLHNGTLHFPEGTAALLDGLRTYVYGNANTAYLMDNTTMEVMESMQSNTVFHVSLSRANSAVPDAFFPFEQVFYTHYIPMTDERGALVNNASDMGIAVNADACPVAAWAFIEALLTETGMATLGGRFGSVHISRLYARDYLERGITEEINMSWSDLRPFTGSEADAVSAAADRILAHAERPTTRLAYDFLMPNEVTVSPFMGFIRGTGDAQAALREIENAILYWMGQEIYIEAYVPAPPPEEDPTPVQPVRTLTISADNRHTDMFQQAAEAMNASWQERGVGYTFELVVNDWRWNDPSAVAAQQRQTRLQTELMAGQGPDIFDRNGFPGMNLRHFARSGLIADIYPLMDACQHTNRSDFFENVLEAFEFDGGLYMMPMSFHLYQVAINSRLPQHYIDTHTARETITLREMHYTYVSVRSNPDHAYMRSGMQVATDRFGAIEAATLPFINFNARSANLTHPRFAEHLEIIRRALDGRESITSAGTTDVVFRMDWHRADAVTQFFPRIGNYHVEYRPLTDEAGRLLLSHPTTTWASLVIPAGGQQELAWEFIVYLQREYPKASGRASVDPMWGVPADWAGYTINTPILRANADMPRRLFESVANPEASSLFFDWDFSGPWEDYVDAAMTRLAELNEMPMALWTPMLPFEIIAGPDGVNLTNFLMGVLSAEDYAQLIHNSVSLWLIE